MKRRQFLQNGLLGVTGLLAETSFMADQLCPHSSMPSVEQTSEQFWNGIELYIKDQKNRDYLIKHYMYLVRHSADRLLSRLPKEGIKSDEMISAGVNGLKDAIDSFDPSSGRKFEHHCVMPIRMAMLDAIRNMDWVPRLVRDRR